jgi:GxxExxY protein
MINTDNKLIYADLTYKVRGALFTVYNTLGYGHKEEVYQKALANEFRSLKLPYKREVHLKVNYKDETVGTYRPDFLVDEKIILELKAVTFMPKSFESQLLHYLKTTGVALGLLINFGSTKLFIKRLIWTKSV